MQIKTLKNVCFHTKVSIFIKDEFNNSKNKGSLDYIKYKAFDSFITYKKSEPNNKTKPLTNNAESYIQLHKFVHFFYLNK